jgi:hypothetical protein
MTTPPPGPGRVDSGYPGPFGSAGSEDRTRPVQAGAYQAGAHHPGAHQPAAYQPSPVPTQYLPPEPQPSWPQPGGYPQPGPYGQQQPGSWAPPGGPGSPYPPFQPPPPSGGGNRTGLVVGLVVLVLVLVGGGSGWYFLLGPGAQKQPAADRPSASGPAAPSGAPSGGAAPEPGADKGGDVAVDVEIGDCVTLSGSDSNADAEPATCGSGDANYKVFGKAPSQAQCASDADATYFESLGGTEVGALCLDFDWVEGDCYDVSGQAPVRVSCTGAGGSKRVQVGATIKGTTSVTRCPDTGYPYDERKFVVCLSTA